MMDDKLREMAAIMSEKEKDISNAEPLPLDPEGRAVMEKKRFTFDIVNTPSDPLR